MNATSWIKILFAIFTAAAITFSLEESYQYHWFYSQGPYHFFFGYVFGSIPFGYLLTHFFGKTDIRTIGSGNIGATNVLRTGRKGLAAMTLLFDAIKGVLAIGTTLWLYKPYPEIYLTTIYLVALGALIGHIFPVWLNFKGGKGVATAFGLLLVLSWPIALAALATWLLTAAIFRFSSLAALITTALVPFYAYLACNEFLMFFSFILNLLIFISHFGNIKRLIQKQEPKIGCKIQPSISRPPN